MLGIYSKPLMKQTLPKRNLAECMNIYVPNLISNNSVRQQNFSRIM